MQHRGGFGVIDDFELLAVPVQLGTAQSNTQRAKKHSFCKWTCELKIRHGLTAGFARIDPFAMMAHRTWQCWRWSFVLFIATEWQQHRLLTTPTGDQDLAFVTDQNDAVFARQWQLVIHFLGALRR